MAIFPQENTNKLLAKWKGPFTISEIPNRFQVKYKEEGITRLTHISYVKKFHEKALQMETRQKEGDNQEETTKQGAWLRLTLGTGKQRKRIKVIFPRGVSPRVALVPWRHTGPGKRTTYGAIRRVMAHCGGSLALWINSWGSPTGPLWTVD